MSGPIIQQPQQQSRAGTFSKLRSEEILRQANVLPAEEAIQPEKEPGTVGQAIVALKTNLHRLDLDTFKQVKIYRYEIKIVGVRQNGHEITLTAQSLSDYTTYERRYICLGVYKAFLEHLMTTSKTKNIYYYDLQRLFFTLNDMNLHPKSQDFAFLPAQIRILIPFEDLMNEFAQYRLKITQFHPNFQLTLGDFSSLMNKDLDRTDTSVEQFLNIATSQNIFNDPANFVNYSASAFYMMQPSDYRFTREDCPEFPSNASFLGIGVHKNVRPISAPNGDINYAMIVQVKKSPFHVNIDMTIAEKVLPTLEQSGDIHRSVLAMKAKVEDKVKGIWVITTHRPHGQNFKFEVKELSEKDCSTQTIQHGDRRITILDYFQTVRYRLTLQHPNLPLVVRKKPNGEDVHYPMELLKIFDNQRVKQDEPAAIAQMIRHTAIPPAKLMQQNDQVRPSLGLDGVNPPTDAAGIKFNRTPMEVNGRLLPHPEIEFAREQKEKPRMPEASWKGIIDQYLVPANVGKWLAISISVDGDKKGIHPDTFRNFVESLHGRMTHTGMRCAPPNDIRYMNSKEINFEDLFNGLVRDNYEFVLFAHPDSEDLIHHSMKYYEQHTEVITQGIRNSTITKFVERHQTHTMANIVHKTNVKMGGLNYLFHPSILPTQELRTYFGNEVLYIGFAANIPGAGFRIKSDDDLLLFPLTQNGAQNGKNGNGSKPNGGTNGNGGGNNGNGGGSNNGPQPQTSTSKESTTNGGNNGAQIKPNPPTVIGFSANIGKKNRCEFVGDYVFQEPVREARIDLVAWIVQRCANQFCLREKAFPKSIILFHNGLDEGSFKGLLKFQVPLVKQALRDINCNAKVSLFVVNKRQPIRLFPNRVDPRLKSPEQNIHPGTVVDTGIVRPNYTEFYLNSHRPIQGTARVPRYNILLDENNLSMDMIQMICHVLCFGHQIVYSPTSLPTPVFVAEEYAKRGRNNFNTWASIGSATFAGIRNHQQLTDYLSMTNTHFLRYMRPNA